MLQKLNPYHLNAVGMTISGLIFLVFAMIFENQANIPLDVKNIFAIFFLTVPGTVVTWGIYIWLFNHLPVTQISYTAFYPPIIATFVGWHILKTYFEIHPCKSPQNTHQCIEEIYFSPHKKKALINSEP